MSPHHYSAGAVLADRYRIVAHLGAGASANVYLADDLQLGRRVAVKVLRDSLAGDAGFLKRFRAEARAVAALNHPNIMHVYDSGEDRSAGPVPVPFLVMEFVGGGSLRAVLDSSGLLTPSQALLVGLDAARGLEYAHRRGFVHRDIKPANLLFGEESRLRIADFGLARAFAEATWTEPEGVLLGTARYSAPEQALGRPVDGRSDVYSLALVLVEATTGEVPFTRDTTQATLMARTERDLEVPRSLGRLAPVLERAGRRDPDLRPDAAELKIALVAASEEMDRPDDLRLPGAIPESALDALVAAAGDAGDGEADERPGAFGARDDDTVVVLPADVTLIAAPDETQIGPLPTVATVPPSARGGRVATAELPVVVAEPDDDAATRRSNGSGDGPVPRIDISLDSGPFVGDRDREGDAGRRRPRHRHRRALSRRRVAAIALVLALVGAAAGWYFVIRVPTAEVPDLRGMQVDDATGLLRRRGLRVATEFTREDGTKPGQVVAQSPRPSTALAEGRAVRLKVSRGNPLVPVPTLTSEMDEATAVSEIEAAGLVVGERTEAFDEVVPAGRVLSYSIDAADQNGQVPGRSPVDVVISSGPTPRRVPSGLVGQPLDAVTARLSEVQLVANPVEEFSDEPIGTVLGLSQPDDAEVPRDTVVDVRVSKGPETFPIPDVRGRNALEAELVLRAQGFGVAQVFGPPSGTVTGVAPQVGSYHPRGTSVQLLTSG